MVCAKLRLGTCSIESLDTCCKNVHCLTVSFVNLYVPSKWKVFGDLTHNLDSKQNLFFAKFNHTNIDCPKCLITN